jgi:hypothetical protein
LFIKQIIIRWPQYLGKINFLRGGRKMQVLRSTQKKVVITLLLVMLLCLPVIGWSAQSFSNNVVEGSADMVVAWDEEEPDEEEVEPDEEEVEPDEEEVEPDEEEVEPDEDDIELEDVE